VTLVVRGFSLQEAVAAEQVAEAIQALPRFHIRGLREIVYSPGEPLHYPSLGQRPTACAEYRQRERTIFVYRTDDAAQFWHVLRHEVGHHVFFLVLDSAVRKSWVTWTYPGSRCATPYGETGAAEDFAECYALYACDPALLEAFPEKQWFMRSRVFTDEPARQARA
jgi:hypothetical protein